jgi:phosphatidyl-myo-inositol alpha-mannosyltransferase
MSRLTIGYILDDSLDVMDGVQQAMLNIGEEMRRRGHDVHYLVPKTNRTDIRGIHSLGDFYRLAFNGNSVRTPKFLSKKTIRGVYDSVRFDVLHVQMPYSPLFASKLLKYAPKVTPKVGTFHILPYDGIASLGTTFLGKLMHASHRSLDVVYAVSKPALDFMSTSYGLQGTVLPNPIDYSFFHAHASQADKSQKKVVYVGRFDERKGVRELAHAIKLLREAGQSDVSFTMCGKGPLLQWVQSFNTQYALDIQLPGFVDDVQKAQELASATIAIFPSKSGESFGIVLTEAMSSGASVVLGGDNPGYRSVLSPWPDSLFDATSPQAIADKISFFLNETDIRTQIGREQQTYVKQFDIIGIADKLELSYQSLVAKQR